MREQTAELFAKVLSDKLVGPKVRIILSKFLPPIFMDAMRDSAEASVHMFEGMVVPKRLPYTVMANSDSLNETGTRTN